MKKNYTPSVELRKYVKKAIKEDDILELRGQIDKISKHYQKNGNKHN